MKKIDIYVLFLVGMILASCSDYLDRLPSDRPSSANFLQNKAELDLALTAAYRVFYYNSNGSHIYLALDGCTYKCGCRYYYNKTHDKQLSKPNPIQPYSANS